MVRLPITISALLALTLLASASVAPLAVAGHDPGHEAPRYLCMDDDGGVYVSSEPCGRVPRAPSRDVLLSFQEASVLA